jgi:myo-inositol-1-phosphate synthase
MRVGVMIVGLRGATASTVVATALRPRQGDLARFLITEGDLAKTLGLARVEDLVFGGWDVAKESWRETIQRHGVIDLRLHPELLASLEKVDSLPGVALGLDHATVNGEIEGDRRKGGAILEAIRTDIRAFRAKHRLDGLVVLSLAAPAKLPNPETWPKTADELLTMLEERRFESALPYYLAAAALEGASIADYTASATLEMPGLLELATKCRVAVAGRDGSTGQTLLKSVLAETFSTRKLRVRGWYSTNILGNHDGLVLQDERYSDVKKHDKTALLEEILGYEVETHLVDIRYYLPAGDEKEAWDAIDFETWFGGRGRLRIDWQASDSLLATPPIIDLVRLVSLLQARGFHGIRPELGLFFKHPLGTEERRYLHLARELEKALLELSARTQGSRGGPSPWDS